jgi:general secretion pathway protein C
VPRPPGPLNRAEVDALLASGLGSFLARIRVTPVLSRGGRFVGFRLDNARDLDAWRASGVDIRVGDVIVRVNGIRVERPEQALWAFERLRIASAIEIDLLRDGTTTTVRSPIVDVPTAAARE